MEQTFLFSLFKRKYKISLSLRYNKIQKLEINFKVYYYPDAVFFSSVFCFLPLMHLRRNITVLENHQISLTKDNQHAKKKLKTLRSVGLIVFYRDILEGFLNTVRVEKLETRSNRKCNLLWPPFSCLVFRLFLLKEKEGKEEGGGRVQYGMASFELMSFCSYSEDFPLQLGLLSSNSG